MVDAVAGRKPVWELQWWADYLKEDGKIGRKRESTILGYAAELTRKQALKLASEKLLPLNQGKLTPMATIRFKDFIDRFFVPNALPTLKLSTRNRYRSTLNFHLKPAFGHKRLCDVSTLNLQSLVLSKMEGGSGWEVLNHLVNLMSKVFESAKKWGHYAGENPATGVELPEKIPVHEKHALTVNQTQRLLGFTRRTGSNDGSNRYSFRFARRGDSRFAMARRRSPKPVYADSTSRISGFSRQSKDQRQQTHPSPSGSPGTCIGSSPAGVNPSRWSGVPHERRNTLQRHQPARTPPETGCKQIGAPWIGWHTLRRTHATLLSQSGASPKDAQAQLGHAHISTTMDIYTQPTPAHQREAVEKMSQLVTNGDELAIWPKMTKPQTARIQ